MKNTLIKLIAITVIPISGALPAETPPERPEMGARNAPKVEMVHIPTMIAEKAREHGVSVDLALELSYWESKWKIDARNREGSSAKGLFQFIDGTWESVCVDTFGYEDVFSPEENTGCAMELIAAGGLHPHWTADPRICVRLVKHGFWDGDCE